MADIKVDFKYAGVEQSEIQKYEKDIINPTFKSSDV